MTKGWSEDEIAARVAADLPEHAVVNLGIGLPVRVAGHIPAGKTVFFHSENGIIGLGPAPQPGREDPDVVNAAKKQATLIPGASIVHHADSFALIRGGRLDYSILGALQVSASGDIANWKVPGQKGGGGVGGAMDLAVGARNVLVMMRHQDKAGAPKLVQACAFPLTAVRTVTRVYTELGIFECAGDAFVVREMAPGVSQDELLGKTEAVLRFA
ncbi:MULTISPECIES: 3-oxoacid CoA-transferase subunit B [unclassified Achromobacter]|uniref:3-oxoacid CoA-transferase subunit B n=1 Tax=unclassified Achromobacter TaxID=2626865 RepID=UPI00069D1C3C|nr:MULTISPECIES: 3-oxoacid CoA-transferase subunit B [unclassified Achromobacter]KOF54447.1 succinyl-CoA:3-ketoacid-CoA transferase [Achromobacter sp. DMS1]KOF55396.1 succinyl-CoA:3-ketoacid-CoA transferase [Achromobacter sp. DMS1]